MVTPMDKDKEADTRLNVEKTFLEKSIASDALSVDIAMPRVRSLSKFKIDETKNNGEGNSCCIQFIRQNKIVLWIERVVLIWICIAVAGGFSVPIIIYACDTDRGNNTKSLSDFNLNSCPGTTLVQEEFNTSESVLSLYDGNCVEYSGICEEYLQDKTSLFTVTLNGISKNDFITFVEYLNQYSSIIRKQCRDAVIPFLCQYAFPPCDVSSGNISVISKTQCTNIRDVLCSVEWNLAIKISSSAAKLLPNCENFNNDDDNNDNASTELIVPQSLQCHYQFKEFCRLCLPLCGKFSQYRVETKFQQRSIVIFAGAVAFIGGILVFIASVYRRKAMLEFPSVLVVYNTMCAFVVACFVLISYMGGQERLYCSDERLDIAYDNPSLFCQISGFVFHWALMLLAEFWILHLIHLFMKIAFPLWSRKLDRKKIKFILHVMEVTGAIFLCSIAPTLFVIFSKYQFGRLPPLICNPSKEVSFYTLCLPLCIIMAIGMILAIIMFWILHKRRQLFSRKNSKYFCIISFSIPEVKILILSCYFMVFGIIALINFSIDIRDVDITVDRLLDYFACQATGYSANHTCYEEYDRLRSYLHPELFNVVYILLGLVPCSNLLFAVQVSDIKNTIQKVIYFYSGHSSQDKTVSSISATNNTPADHE